MLLIGNGTLLTRNPTQPLLQNGCVAVYGNKIAGVGSTDEFRSKYRDAVFIDARDRVIMPGLINTHMHFYSSFARGMDLRAESPRQFNEILERLWWRLDKKLTLEDVYYSAAVALIDCIKNGTTTVFDHHASPGCVRDSLFQISAVAEKMGIRTCLCYEVSDRDGEDVAQQGIDENVEYVNKCQREADSMRRGMFGLHASFTLNDELLRRSVESAGTLGVGCHIHTAEALTDVEDCLRRYGKRVVERLNDFEVLGPGTIAAHCVHVNESEIEILRRSHAQVVHNPESNMGNAVGCAPVLAMMEQGIPVGLGTDGYTCDMFESLKMANLLHKHQARDASVAWQEPHSMLFDNNARFASACFGEKLGQLVPGAVADILVVDYDPPTPMNDCNINGHVLFGMSGRSVVTTVVNGRVLMQERRLLIADEREILAKARDCAGTLWKRF